MFYFKNNKQIVIDFSYYIIDNQVTRSLMLDYELKKRRESLEKQAKKTYFFFLFKGFYDIIIM